MSLLERSGVGRSVPVPVVPINFLRVPFHLLIYITIYILSSYRISKKGILSYETPYLEQLEQLEHLPEDHFSFSLFPAPPKSPFPLESLNFVLSRYHPRNHQKFVCDSLSSLNSGSSTNIPLLEFSSNLCLAELKAF